MADATQNQKGTKMTTATTQKLFYVACICNKDRSNFSDGRNVHYSPEFDNERDAEKWAESHYPACFVRVIGN